MERFEIKGVGSEEKGEVIRWASSRTENGIPEKRVKMISFRVSLAIV